jgi:hypothetical protein
MGSNKPKRITVHKPSGSRVWETNEEMASSHNRPCGITADRLEEGRGTRTCNDKYKTNSNNKFHVSTMFLAVGILQIHFTVFWILSQC